MRFAAWTLALAFLGQISGCCHDHTEAEQFERARAEDFRNKWIQEVRFHYQTQMIKSEEIKELAEMMDALKAENQELRNKLTEKKAAEVK